MKFILKTLLILALGYFVGQYFPFWSLILVAFIINIVIRTSALSSFFAGFLAIFILWTMLSFLIDQETSSVLTSRVATIFSVSSSLLMLITGIVGGLGSGFGAASGALFINLFRKKRRPSKYY